MIRKIKTPKLKGCYAWYGVPDDFSGDRPQGKYYLDPYRSKWFVATEVEPTKLKNYIFVSPLGCYNAIATEWLSTEWDTFYKALSNKSLDKT